MEQTLTDFLPALNQKVADLTSALAIRVLDINTHRRKWSLILQGLPIEPGEAGDATQLKCVELAKSNLSVPDAFPSDMAACHRLNGNKDAAILIHFLDLDKRNRWLAGAKGLTSYPGKVSLSPDLPPVARQLKNEVLQRRSELDAETKRLSSVIFVPDPTSCPYVAN